MGDGRNGRNGSAVKPAPAGKPDVRMVQVVGVDRIRTDGGTQLRVQVDPAVVEEYAAVYSGDAGQMPQLEVVDDGKDLWLWDGFHRLAGARKAGVTQIVCRAQAGTLEDARWLATSANKGHGLRRTNADKRRYVEEALRLKPEMSDRAIAEHCGVSNELVGDCRRQVSDSDTSSIEVSQPATRVGMDGKTYTVRKTKEMVKVGGKLFTRMEDGTLRRKVEPSKEAAEAQRERARAAAAEEAEEAEDFEADIPPAPKAPTVDSWGIPIQPWAEAAFAQRHRFDEIVADLRAVARKLALLAEEDVGVFLLKHMQSVRVGSGKAATSKMTLPGLENAITHVLLARPEHTDCPYHFNDEIPHEGEGSEPCPLCRGARWLPSLRGRQVPPTLTKLLKAHYQVATVANGEDSATEGE